MFSIDKEILKHNQFIEKNSKENWEYLFDWNINNKELVCVLNQHFYFNFGEKVIIEKTEDGKTIRVSEGEDFLSLRLNDEKNTVIVQYGNAPDAHTSTSKYVAMMKNGKLKICKYTKNFVSSNTPRDERINYFLSLRDAKKNDFFNDTGKGILYLYLLHNIDYSYNIASNFKEAAKRKKWNIAGTGYLTNPAKVSSILKEMLKDGMVEISHTQRGDNQKERIYYKVSIDPLINVLLYEDMLNTIYNSPIRPCFSDFVEVACWVDSSIYFVNKYSKNALESIAVLGDIFRDGLTNMKNTILAYIADILMYFYYILDMRDGENEGEEEDKISTSYKGALDLNGLKKMNLKIKSDQDFSAKTHFS